MIIGIDASNIRAGGGLTHLVNLLAAADPIGNNFERVHVWAGRQTLKTLPKARWLRKEPHRWLDSALPFRLMWQQKCLAGHARQAGCDVLLVPGGNYLGDFHPYVAISQNLLPFSKRDRQAYGHTRARLRLELLRLGQARTFAHADGVIFLSKTARKQIREVIDELPAQNRIVPHGITSAFRRSPRPARPIERCSNEEPFRWLYVSTVTAYKHNWNVVYAMRTLREKGLPVTLDLVGPATGPPKKGIDRLEQAMNECDPCAEYISYHGSVRHEELARFYHGADAFVFASSVENLPITLLEAMSAGLPVASSSCQPMPEVLGDAAVYFDPYSPSSIAEALTSVTCEEGLRKHLADEAYTTAAPYTWERCASETFAFIRHVVAA